jgi:hypothetical protein
VKTQISGDTAQAGAAHDIKFFAWAGLRFQVPVQWETGRLTRDHGWLEADFKPVLEFKTAMIRGRFSLRRHLKRLARSSPLRITPKIPPAGWQPHLSPYETQAFSWEGPNLAGDGLLIHCPICRRATLLQFYRQARMRDDASLVIASWDDHGAERAPTVAVYDIQATVPDALPLESFRFDSGRFELVFGARRGRATLWRWSPADIALRRCDGSLRCFARRHAWPSKTPDAPAPRAVAQGWEWRWLLRRTWRDRLPRRLGRRRAPGALRIWHRPAENRILAVLGDGDLDYETFNGICRRYEIIP